VEHFLRLLAFQDYRETGKARDKMPSQYYDAFSEAYALGEQNAYNPPNLASKEWDGWKRSAQEEDRR